MVTASKAVARDDPAASQEEYALPLRNPRSGESGSFPAPAPHIVAQRAQALRGAQQQWRSLAAAERAAVLQEWQAAISRRRGELLRSLEADTGRRLLAQREIDMVMQRIAAWSERAIALLADPPEGRARAAPGIRWRLQRVPYPLVGVISPWNFPLLLALVDAIPALLAGCAVLLKPSELTPRFTEPLRRTLEEVPALRAVLDIIPGDARSGAAVVQQVDAICFTGSVATGRRVALAAAERLIPAFLELGGKDAALVLASAKLDTAVRAILRSAAGATGQACQSLERIYVAESVAQEFVARLRRAAEEIRPNYPRMEEGHLGPFINPQQAAVVERHLEDAVAQGARIHCGGEIQRHGGFWCLPTVLTEVHHGMLLMREESFAPLLPVMPFRDLEEGLRLANDSDYGLSAAVFAGTEEEALAVAEHINAGAVCINDASLTIMVDDVEKDSFACSGLGVSRTGNSALLRFLRNKALLIQEGEPASLQALDEKNADSS